MSAAGLYLLARLHEDANAFRIVCGMHFKKTLLDNGRASPPDGQLPHGLPAGDWVPVQHSAMQSRLREHVATGMVTCWLCGPGAAFAEEDLETLARKLGLTTAAHLTSTGGGPVIEHLFIPDPFGRDVCDRKLDSDGRVSTCCRPRSEHQADANAAVPPGTLDESDAPEVA